MLIVMNNGTTRNSEYDWETGQDRIPTDMQELRRIMNENRQLKMDLRDAKEALRRYADYRS